MKKSNMLVFIFMFLFMVVTLASAKEVKLRFAWEPNTEADMAGYALFHRTEGQNYDYNNPIDPSCTIVDGLCYVDPVEKVCEFEYTFDTPDGEILTHFFVARAKDTEGKWSGDSDEISYTFDLAPIVSPIITAGIYNDITKKIDLVFSQTDFERVERWDLYMSNVSGGPYNKVDTILREGTGDTFTASWTVTTDGIYYFTIVAFTPENVFSPDSNEMSVSVKSSPDIMKNFIIKIRVQ